MRPLSKAAICLPVLGVLLGLASTGWAATYYVDPNGNDTSGNGSQASPWKTLSNACTQVTTSGDTIHINAGSYADNNRCNLATGITIQGAGTSSVTVTSAYGGAQGTGYIFRETAPASPVPHGNNDISGFTLDGSNKTLITGIWIRGTDQNVIHDMALQHINTHAIVLAGWNGWPDYNTATVTPPTAWGLNDVIHDVTIDDTTTNANTPADLPGAIDLMSLSNCQIYNLTINENYASNGVGIKAVPGWLQGFQLYNSAIQTTPSNTNGFVLETYNFTGDSQVYGCQFQQTLSLNGGPTTLDPGSTWNLTIHDNVFDLTNAPPTSGTEFSHNYLDVARNYFFAGHSPAAGLWETNYLTGSGVAHWRFNNNVVYDCSEGIIMTKGGSFSDIEVFNNTFDTLTANPYGGSGFDASQFSGTGTGLRIQNNLFMNAAATPILTSSGLTGNVIDHNWLNTAGPGINGSGNRPTPYYVPSGATSNLVGAGIDVGLPFTGSAPTIGAYEWNYVATSTTSGGTTTTTSGSTTATTSGAGTTATSGTTSGTSTSGRASTDSTTSSTGGSTTGSRTTSGAATSTSGTSSGTTSTGGTISATGGGCGCGVTGGDPCAVLAALGAFGFTRRSRRRVSRR